MTRLLIIDDDDLTLQLYDLLLDGVEDISFEKAEDGSSALAMLRNINEGSTTASQWPDIIFVDLHMPDMSGYEFVDTYLEQFSVQEQRGSRLYFLTSSISQRDTKKTKEYPQVSGIMTKPLTEEKLKELIKEPI